MTEQIPPLAECVQDGCTRPPARTPQEPYLMTCSEHRYVPPEDPFEAFANDPLAYGTSEEVEPTEAQERVARELSGFRTALIRQGWTREEVALFLAGVFAERARGDFTL